MFMCEITGVDKSDTSLVINLSMPFTMAENTPPDEENREYTAYITHSQNHESLVGAGVAVHPYGSIVINMGEDNIQTPLYFTVYDKTETGEDKIIPLSIVLSNDGTPAAIVENGITPLALYESIEVGGYLVYGGGINGGGGNGGGDNGGDDNGGGGVTL